MKRSKDGMGIMYEAKGEHIDMRHARTVADSLMHTGKSKADRGMPQSKAPERTASRADAAEYKTRK
jgi:hypothetical protein